MKCSSCTQLTNRNLWYDVASKCGEVVKYTTYELLSEKAENCSLLCRIVITDFDWKSWCVEPRISFEDVCPETCLNKFQSVNWISEDGFCASVDNYTGNVKLQESACATFKTLLGEDAKKLTLPRQRQSTRK